MGTVRSRFWRGERVWFIDYIAADGRRVRQTIGPGEQNRRYAKQILLQREAEATLGRNHIPVSRTVRFAEFARDWLKRIASRVKPKTLETYENALQALGAAKRVRPFHWLRQRSIRHWPFSNSCCTMPSNMAYSLKVQPYV